jgi:EAL domain-containing protein (putative c-di-GMP-specific phosphodiesterase class I)
VQTAEPFPGGAGKCPIRDRCFVSDIEFDGSSAIVQAVVNIAASRNMTTTAEGARVPA